MNIYEKIIAGVVGVVVVLLGIFSYFELTEDVYTEFEEGETSDFDESFGDSFKMGTFVTVLESDQSEEREADCELQKPVIVSILHDLNEELETSFVTLFQGDDSFQVNQKTLDILCAKTATITLGDSKGNTLVLEKIPFVTNVISQQYEGETGTQVEIRATLTEKDRDVEEEETFTRTMLIPDNLLIQAQ